MDFSSKRPPVYLRLGGGDNEPSAVDRGVKERYIRVPVHQLRRTAAELDLELGRLRAELAEEAQAKKREALRAKRLERRCGVQVGESVEDLGQTYAGGPHLQRLPDPADGELAARGPPTKDFFRQLGRRRVASGARAAQ